MSNLQPNCCLKIDFQKVGQHARGKWLIHDHISRILCTDFHFGKYWNILYENLKKYVLRDILLDPN